MPQVSFDGVFRCVLPFWVSDLLLNKAKMHCTIAVFPHNLLPVYEYSLVDSVVGTDFERATIEIYFCPWHFLIGILMKFTRALASFIHVCCTKTCCPQLPLQHVKDGGNVDGLRWKFLLNGFGEFVASPVNRKSNIISHDTFMQLLQLLITNFCRCWFCCFYHNFCYYFSWLIIY